MTTRNKITYWVATGILALGMMAQGLAQLIHTKGYTNIIVHLGYPLYFLDIIGAWKILGVIVVLLPRFTLVKEWAYAGFFFVMSGAAASHIASGDSVTELLPSLVLLGLIGVSWYFRPANRKIISFPQQEPHEKGTLSPAA
ncbi:DoxX family protein [Spirosoma arcticum]